MQASFLPACPSSSRTTLRQFRSHQARACSFSSCIKQNMHSMKLQSRGRSWQCGPATAHVGLCTSHPPSWLAPHSNQQQKDQCGPADTRVPSVKALAGRYRKLGSACTGTAAYNVTAALNALQRQLQLARLHTATVIASSHNLQQAAVLLACHCVLCAGLGDHPTGLLLLQGLGFRV